MILAERPLAQHFTPLPVARELVRLALDGLEGEALAVVDPACGDGAFLDAAALELGDRVGSLVGVDIDPGCIEAAAGRSRLALASLRVADALAVAGAPPLEDGGYDLVVLNPPYIGEKGNKALFDAARELSPRWAARSVARMDYLYHFMHLGLDLLRSGGRMVALTTAYWPGATSATKLREDLLSRGRLRWFVEFVGDPIFSDATGQSNLAVVVERATATEPRPGWYGWRRLRYAADGLSVEAEESSVPTPTGGAPWQPFVDAGARARLEAIESRGVRLAELAIDRQGVVSGADRDRAGEGDRPIFVLTRAEVQARGWDRDPALTSWLEPLLRGSTIEPLSVVTRRASVDGDGAPDDPFMLYIDGTRPVPAPLLAHLEPHRSRLEARREVRQGLMAWYRLHWPRERALMARPKLVTARRAPCPRWCLDLAGHVVNSDCTFLVPLGGLDLEALGALLVALHSPDVSDWLALAGKRKAALYEFYSEPLRRLPVAVGRAGERLVAGDAGRWRELVATLRAQGRLEALDAAIGEAWFDKALPT